MTEKALQSLSRLRGLLSETQPPPRSAVPQLPKRTPRWQSSTNQAAQLSYGDAEMSVPAAQSEPNKKTLVLKAWLFRMAVATAAIGGSAYGGWEASERIASAFIRGCEAVTKAQNEKAETERENRKLLNSMYELLKRLETQKHPEHIPVPQKRYLRQI